MFVALVAASLALPAAITGDFDNDGRPDSARFVLDGAGAQLEIRLASRPDMAWRPADASVNEGNLYLRVIVPRRPPPPCADQTGSSCPAAAKLDAIAFGTSETTLAVVMWTGTDFRTHWLTAR